MKVILNKVNSVVLANITSQRVKVVGKVIEYKANKITRVRILRPQNITDTEMTDDNTMIIEGRNKKEVKIKINYYLLGQFKKFY